MSGPTRTHVVIAGGGPAGLAAAIRLRLHGVAATVCDAGNTGTTRLGERVSGRFRDLLSALEIEPALVAGCAQPSAGIVSLWGSSTPHLADSCLDPYGPAWHLDRPSFERVLRDRAVALGARILTDTRVVDTRLTTAGAWTVTTRNGAVTSTRDASVIVDAGGRTGRDPLGRLRLTGARDMLLATAFIFAAPLTAPSSNWTLVEACASGWWYSAPLPRNESSIMFFSDRDSAHRHETDVHKLAALTGARLTIDRIPQGAPVQVCRRVAALGCAVQENSLCIPIGDAALALDPLSGSGLYVAVHTGITAADAIREAANGQPEKLGEYRDCTRTTFSAHLAARARLYAAEGRWPDRPFWQRRSALRQDTGTDANPTASPSPDLKVGPTTTRQAHSK